MVEFLVGVLLGAVGVALTLWVKRIVPQPGRVRAVEAQAHRGLLDLTVLIARQREDMAAELRASEATVTVSELMDHRRDIRAKYTRAIEDESRSMLRTYEDLLGQLGPIERWVVRRRLKADENTAVLLQAKLEQTLLGDHEENARRHAKDVF